MGSRLALLGPLHRPSAPTFLWRRLSLMFFLFFLLFRLHGFLGPTFLLRAVCILRLGFFRLLTLPAANERLR